MSGTKIAMPHPNSFQSGALSFMSCTSGRESSPLDESDSHRTGEFKTETKKKRFHPLRNLRRMFRRKTRRTSISAESYQPGVLENPETTPTNLEHRSCSTSRLQEENLTQNLIRNSRLNPGLSLSHDSIFTPDRADSGLSSSDLENSSLSITVLTPPSKECPIKSQSSCSETSLLSIGSSEVELSPIRSANISDLDLGVTSYKLSHSAAKHKMAVKPKRNHGVPRSRRMSAKSAMTSKSPLPITIEVSEEGAAGRVTPTLETSSLGTSELVPPLKCDKKPQDAKISWSDIAVDSNAKELEEKTHEITRAEDESDAKDQELTNQRSESFFGRFLSRRSDKKKKVLQESNVEENDEKSHFVKKFSKTTEGKGARKTPNRRQRVEPMEIPSTSSVNKFEKEKEDFIGKKNSSSVSPPRSYWPNQVTSRSISPPKVVWPDSRNCNSTAETMSKVSEKFKTDVSPSKQAIELGMKDWKNPNFVKELTDSVSFFARDKSERKEKDEEDEIGNKVKKQHSEDLPPSPQKTSISVENVLVLKTKSDSSEVAENVKSSDVENTLGDITITHTEPSHVGVKVPSLYAFSYESIHDGYENIQIIEQVKQEVKNSVQAQPVQFETKPEPSREPEKPNKLEIDLTKKESDNLNKPEKEQEVVKRVKPVVSEKPKDLKKTLMTECIKTNANTGDPKTSEESDKKIIPKTKTTLVERRKSELLLLTETEEKEWKAKIKPLKKQTSFSETSTEKRNFESSQRSPLPKEKETFIEKTEPSPEITEEVVVVLRKKSVTNPSDEQPELMKVFARRSLKIKESEKTVDETQKSRDSDKENEIVESPKEDRKKIANFDKDERKETENLISKEGVRVPAKEKPTNMHPASFKPEISSRNTVFQRYGRSLSENNAKPKEETEFKRDSIVLEENFLNKVKTVTEKSKIKLEKVDKEQRDEEKAEEETGFKRIQQRKAEWERRAQQGAK